MKILSIGDVHYSLREFDWLLEKAGGVEQMILLGDLLDVSGYLDLDTQILVATKYLDRLKQTTTLAVCSGICKPAPRNSPGGLQCFIVIDLEAEEVVWSSLNGSCSITLDISTVDDTQHGDVSLVTNPLKLR